jgi:hypothetical protein
MRLTGHILSIVGVLSVAGLAKGQVQYPNSQQLNFGATIGYYFPTDKVIRDAFGNKVVNVGFSPVKAQRPSSGSISPDVSVLSADQNGNKLFLGSLSFGYEYHFSNDQNVTLPYVRPFVGGSYFDYGITQAARRQSLKRIGYTYGIEAGLVIAQRIRVAGTYNVFSKEQAFNFNGFTVSATYAFKL